MLFNQHIFKIELVVISVNLCKNNEIIISRLKKTISALLKCDCTILVL